MEICVILHPTLRQIAIIRHKRISLKNNCYTFMKKIYTIFTLLIAALCSMAAQAETRTVTIHVDDPTHIDHLSDWDSYSTIFEFNDDGIAEVICGDGAVHSLEVEPKEGFKITSITSTSGAKVTEIYATFPTSSYAKILIHDQSDGFIIDENDEIFITTEAPKTKIITLKGNADHIQSVEYGFSYSKTEIDSTESGTWVIDATDEKAIYITAKDSYIIRDVTDEQGKIVSWTQNQSSVQVYTDDIKETCTLTISTYNLDESRTATMHISVTGGDFSYVGITRKDGSTVTLSANEETVSYNPDTEIPFTFKNAKDSYGNLYKVVIADNPENSSAVKNTYNWTVTPTNGCTVLVEVKSNEPVPVHFTFPNEGTEGVISAVTVDDTKFTDGEWLGDDFTVTMGSKVYISYNSVYTVSTIKVNNEEKYSLSSFTVTEDEYNIEITATKQAVSTITVVCEEWENVIIQTSSSNYPLTGATTVIEVPQTTYRIYAKAENGYIITGVFNASEQNIYSEDGFYFNNGETLRVEAEKFVRSKQIMAFLENVTWDDAYIRLAPYSSNEEYIYLKPGYQQVDFAAGDFEKYGSLNFFLPGYSRGVIYLNDNVVEYDYGYYPAIEQVKDGDVLKIYAEEKTTHTVTYQIADDANAEVWHDHITAIESPATHDVLPGTIIHIKPGAVAAMTRAADLPLTVTVNDEAIQPDDEGIYTITADGNKTIKVEKNQSTSISEINADSAGKAYDLQGRRVAPSTRGLIIVNGKKVIK